MSVLVEQVSIDEHEEVLCTHCANPVPSGLVDANRSNQFCCEGCRAVYQTITGCGLGEYYRLRALAVDSGPPVELLNTKFGAFDSESFLDLYAAAIGNHRQIEFVLEGITCGACVWLVEKLPEVLPGVVEARLNLRAASVRITWDPSRVQLSTVAGLLARFGYTPHPAKGVDRQALIRRTERKMLIDIGVAFALMGNLMLVSVALYAGWAGDMDATMTRFFRWISVLLGVVSLSYPGRCFFINAWRSIRNRAANLDLPIAIALVAGGVGGVVNVISDHAETYFDTLSMLVFLLLVGRYIQHRQQRRADAAVELLFSMMPSTVHVEREGAFVDLPGEALRSDDRVEVRSGELVPGDGVILRGSSSIDQALLTGESVPVDADIGDRVFGGSLNRGRPLVVQLEAVGKATRVGRLMELVEQGLAEKPSAMRFADRVGRWFVPGVCVAAAATFAVWIRISFSVAIDHSIAMLIVTCPCVLGLATPLTMSVALGQLARRRILVKSAAALERLAEPGTLAFDKTGTLTEGRPAVVSYVGDPSFQPIVACIEGHATHPIAGAIHRAYFDPTFDKSQISEVHEPAHGGIIALYHNQTVLIGSARFIESQGIAVDQSDAAGRTLVCVAVNRAIVAMIELQDQVRPDAAEAIARLDRAGWSVSMLSGDRECVTSSVGTSVGIAESRVNGQCNPEEKLAWIRSRQQAGTVVMIGDGVNDAAALAAADVGIAVRGGAEASLSAADVYIATPGVMPVVELITTAKRTMRIVRQNFGITLFYNLIAGTLAITGHMNPLVAAILMPLSGLTTIGVATASVRVGAKSESGKADI